MGHPRRYSLDQPSHFPVPRTMTLPTEPCYDIVEHVTSKSDLYVLLFTSRILRHSALRVLLRVIDMRPNDPHSSLNNLKPFVIQRFERINASPSLALVVQKLIFYRHVIKDELLHTILPLMTNIRHLCFATPPHPIFFNFSLQLTSFEFLADSHGRKRGARKWINSHMTDFLNRQNDLTELTILQPPKTEQPLAHLSPNAMPHLDTLTFHVGPGLARILEGRGVKRLHTLHRAVFDVDAIPVESLKQIRVLVCNQILQTSPTRLYGLVNLVYLQTLYPFFFSFVRIASAFSSLK